jgi:starch-binding outer membrane protein, SusD/RagB family
MTFVSLPRQAGRRRLHGACGGALAAMLLTGCDLGVTNPGPIEDAALDTPAAMAPLVVGMGADLSAIVDDVSYFMGIASRDIWHSGAFEPEFFMQDGKIEPRHVNALWAGMHRARWVAEQGIERMRTVLGAEFETSRLAAEAHLWAGYSNRVLGETVCHAVIDGGAPEPHTVHFERAERQFTDALQLAQRQNNAALQNAAHAGRAQVRAALGKWTEAAADAARVPDSYAFLAQFSTNSTREQNWLFNESHIRAYFTVFGTWAATVTDPRVPWQDMNRNGVDGRSPYIRQMKYTSYAADIDLARGDEMRLIEAEAALRANDVAAAVDRINHVRRAANVAPVDATTADAAWTALRREREIVLWMEGRRLWDLRRFNDPFLATRDRCLPISQNEQNTNPRVRG